MKNRPIAVLLLAGAAMVAQEDHHKAVDARGNHVMGFSHEKTTHHFRLYADGGAIEVTANDSKDAESRDQIRMHLSHIAGMFAGGNFKAPMLIHDQVPPGVPTLERLKTEVSYRYEDIEAGGRVRIATQNKEALSAVHEFLKFQIADHRTGDTTTVAKSAAAR
jgi:hypothetical protein